jgi:hypothetical protein
MDEVNLSIAVEVSGRYRVKAWEAFLRAEDA